MHILLYVHPASNAGNQCQRAEMALSGVLASIGNATQARMTVTLYYL